MAEDEEQRNWRLLNVLVDTNVAIDWLNDRKPWSEEALPLWKSRDAGRASLYLPASVVTDIYYILRKPLGNKRSEARHRALYGDMRPSGY